VLPGKAYTPEVVLEIVWRHKWLVVIPFVAIVSGVAFYASSLPNLYRSETLIMVVPQRIPDIYVRSAVTSRIEERLRSISEQTLTRTRLEQVILEFDLYPEQRSRLPMEQVVEIMRQQITPEPIRGDMFRIAFAARDAEVAARVVTRLADMYIEENQRDRTVIAEDTNEFLESQMLDAKDRLVAHEKKLEAYRLRHAGELPSQFQANLQMIQASRVQLEALTESLNRDRDRRTTLNASLAEAERSDSAADRAAVLTSSAADGDPLETARRELRDLERRLTDQHPDLVVKRRQVEELERQAGVRAATSAQNVDAGVTQASERQERIRRIKTEIASLDEQIRSQEEEETRLNTVIADYRRRVEAVPVRETEMTELMRDYETLQQTYKGLLSAKESSSIAANLERRQIGEQFKILDPARPAERPFSPNRVRLNLMGALAGLVFGLGLVGLLEYRDTTFRTEADVLQVLSVPVLAVIPFMESPREQRSRRLRIALTGAAVVALIAVTAAVMLTRYDVTGWFR
jgi:polysaccharide chain length determinant protein (PEP-CTERM system associated)